MTRLLASFARVAGLASSGARAEAFDDVVLGEADSTPPLALPTVASRLDSLDDVNTALDRERRRVAAQKPADGGLDQPLRNATDFRRIRVRSDGRMDEV